MIQMTRNLVVILGDQLNRDSSAFDGFDPKTDRVWMAEVQEESTHIKSSKQRIAIFLSSMRHFAKSLNEDHIPLSYTLMDHPTNAHSLEGELLKAITTLHPQRLVMTTPGDWRVLEKIRTVAKKNNLTLEIRPDRYFYSTVEEFSTYAKGRKQLRLEYWYRELRKKYGILMEKGKPIGGEWNYDQENRSAFDKKIGPPVIPPPLRFAPDFITEKVIDLVNEIFKDHPGSVEATLEGFGWSTTREEALLVMKDFISQRLSLFGQFQDALWTDESWLFHAHLGSALNLKLISPQEVVDATLVAFEKGKVPLSSTEGFIRQILGWREYIRGIYWLQMPDYLESNALNAKHALPDFYWNGDTSMHCLKQTITQSLRTGYAHHIQRLMVTGLYALMFGVAPKEIHAWYLSMYVDAVEWVELPNVIGMSQFADGGLMASKPYIATGKYIHRMSNYCEGCSFNPEETIGETACPFTTLYWDFLITHESLLAKNPRMALQVRNLSRMTDETKQAIRKQAERHRGQ